MQTSPPSSGSPSVTERRADRPKRVAVLAVHGVADQQPFDTVRAIARMLLKLNADGKPAYAKFCERSCQIAVRAIEVRQNVSLADRADTATDAGFEEYARVQRQARRKGEPEKTPSGSARESSDEDPLDSVSYDFMTVQLKDHRVSGDDRTYATLRLEGNRSSRTESANREVHLYEMYWADLSRVGTGLLQIFGDIFQINFHIPSLGVHAVNAASLVSTQHTRWWDVWARSQRWAGNALAIWIAVLNLFLIAASAVVLICSLEPDNHRPVALGLAIVIGLAVFAYVWMRVDVKNVWWAVTPLIVTVAAAALARQSSDFFSRMLAVEAAVIAGLIAWWLLWRYKNTRPHADRWTVPLGMGVVGWFIGGVLTAPEPRFGSLAAALRGIEIISLILIVTWVAFLALLWTAQISGMVVAARHGIWPLSEHVPTPEQRRLTRAQWTARISLALPPVVILVVMMTLWAAAQMVLLRFVPHFNFRPVTAFMLEGNPGARSDFVDSHQFIGRLVNQGGTGLGLILIALAAASLLAIWSVLPSVWSEVWPHDPRRQAKPLGLWLDSGFRLLRASGRILYVAVAVGLPIAWWGALPDAWRPFTSAWVEPFSRWDAWAIERLGVVIAGSAGTLLALRGRLTKFAVGFRTALDVLLDVDSYLREHPLYNNPKGRIFARCASTLRHISNEQRADGTEAYDAIVIVAHSQGSVIMGDFFRWLRRHPDPTLNRIVDRRMPVHLFTMGNPLRQLYGVRFPHLYWWATREDQPNWPSNAGADITAPPPILPDPHVLGVTTWVNAYRSGDYVGRSLWRSSSCSFMYSYLEPPTDGPWNVEEIEPQLVSDDGATKRSREFCIGAGAHTHYWDDHGALIAVELDRLIGV